MIKIFRWFYPKQIARYVKTFHHGVFFIAEQGPFRFEHGTVCYEGHQGNALRTLAEINRQSSRSATVSPLSPSLNGAGRP